MSSIDVSWFSRVRCAGRWLGGAAAAGVLLAGCAMPGPRRAHGTSVVQFLYPEEAAPLEEPAVPVLRLPLRVGIALVPAGEAAPGRSHAGPLTEAAKAELLARVSAGFRALPYVKSIEVIPSTYLRPGGGFTNLDQLKAMFGVEVIALVAYDQTQFTEQGLLSLAYWTIVGAYVVQGEKNDTQTLTETVVYDIASRRLLFRAPGTSRVRASATPVNLAEELRRDSARGFDLAAADMVTNLEAELAAFRTRVKETPTDYQIVHRPGYTGAGAFGPGAAGLAVLAWLVLRRRA